MAFDVELLWRKAFAFEDEHGENAPAILQYKITRLSIDGRIAEAAELASIGVLLDTFYRAGGKTPN